KLIPLLHYKHMLCTRTMSILFPFWRAIPKGGYVLHCGTENTLPAPNLSACSFWIFSEVTISFHEIQVNCTHRFFYRRIVTVVDNGTNHAAEYRFDYV